MVQASFLYVSVKLGRGEKKWATGPPAMNPSKLYVNPQEEDQMVTFCLSVLCMNLIITVLSGKTATLGVLFRGPDFQKCKFYFE